MNNNLSLFKLLDGLTKSINIAKKIIPLYRELQPIINKSNEYFNKLSINEKQNKINNNIKEEIITSNKPIFFQ